MLQRISRKFTGIMPKKVLNISSIFPVLKALLKMISKENLLLPLRLMENFLLNSLTFGLMTGRRADSPISEVLKTMSGFLWAICRRLVNSVEFVEYKIL